MKGVANGANNGFQILLDAESYDYASSATGSEGFVISVLHHLDIPVMKQIGVQVSSRCHDMNFVFKYRSSDTNAPFI